MGNFSAFRDRLYIKELPPNQKQRVWLLIPTGILLGVGLFGIFLVRAFVKFSLLLIKFGLASGISLFCLRWTFDLVQYFMNKLRLPEWGSNPEITSALAFFLVFQVAMFILGFTFKFSEFLSPSVSIGSPSKSTEPMSPRRSRNIIPKILIISALLAGIDRGFRYWEMLDAGPGVEIRPGQLLVVSPTQVIRAGDLPIGSKLQFNVTPSAPMGSTYMGDAFMDEVVINARIVNSGFSEQLSCDAVLFEFDSVILPNGRSLKFKASIYSPDDLQHDREAGSMGSYVGMSWGPGGVLLGWLVGNLIPNLAGRVLDAPLSYALREIPEDQELVIKVHYCDFVPFALIGEGDNQLKIFSHQLYEN